VGDDGLVGVVAGELVDGEVGEVLAPGPGEGLTRPLEIDTGEALRALSACLGAIDGVVRPLFEDDVDADRGWWFNDGFWIGEAVSFTPRRTLDPWPGRLAVDFELREELADEPEFVRSLRAYGG
jgi:hypothetical protein